MSFQYKGLSATLSKHTVTDEEVDRQLQRLLQQQNPRIATVTDRPTQLGDEVVLDYAGFCDGEQFAGGTAENQTLVLGSGMFIPGFEEQLLDKVPGEKVTVQVTFPKEYHAENLAGKEAQFQCTVHEIRVKTPYEPDDVFAKEVGQCDTLAQMKEKLKESLQSYADQQGEMDLQDQLLRQAAATLDYQPTEQEMEQAMDEQLRTLEAQLSRQGLTVEMYCSFMNTTKESLREETRENARNAVCCRAAIDKVVQLEQLETTEQEMGEAIAMVCRENDLTVEQLKPYFTAEFEQMVRHSVLTGKVMRLIRDAADLSAV